MNTVVVDASVIVKWILPDHEKEKNVDQALQILQLIRESKIWVKQPPHWLAETAAVIQRLSPDTAIEDIRNLYDTNFEIVDTQEIYFQACELSSELNHHMFDTLYHAVALNAENGFLITADNKYFRKAESFGSIMLLENTGNILKLPPPILKK